MTKPGSFGTHAAAKVEAKDFREGKIFIFNGLEIEEFKYLRNEHVGWFFLNKKD
jgi:hypothetical protein